MWEKLLGDMPSEVQHGRDDAELWVEVAERTRMEYARVSLTDRLRGSLAAELRLDVTGAGSVAGVLRGVGPDWLLLDEPSCSNVVALAALLDVRGLGQHSRGPEDLVDERFALGSVLRGISRDREQVRLTRIDGKLLQGRLNRVGADHVDIVNTYDGERPDGVDAARCVAMTAIALVRVSR